MQRIPGMAQHRAQIDGTVYTPDAALETIDAEPIRIMLGDEILAVDGTVKAFASAPANAALAEVQVHVGEDHLCFTTSGTIRWRIEVVWRMRGITCISRGLMSWQNSRRLRWRTMVPVWVRRSICTLNTSM